MNLNLIKIPKSNQMNQIQPVMKSLYIYYCDPSDNILWWRNVQYKESTTYAQFFNFIFQQLKDAKLKITKNELNIVQKESHRTT